MSVKKTVRVIFLVLFGVTAVISAVVTFADLNSAGRIQDKIDERQHEVDRYIEQIKKANLLYRGYTESMANIPDSTRKAQSGVLMRQMGEFQKQIRKLETDKHESSRQLRKHQRAKAAVYGEMKRRLFILGGVALLFLVAFVVTILRK